MCSCWSSGCSAGSRGSIDNVGLVEGSGKSNAFDYFLTGVVPWLLVVGAAIVTVLLATEALRRGNVPWPLILLGATALGFVLILIRLIISDDPNISGTEWTSTSRAASASG